MLDNFEWTNGYAEKFGLHYVDFEDPDRPRKTKQSAKWFRNLIKDNGWPYSFPPSNISAEKVGEC